MIIFFNYTELMLFNLLDWKLFRLIYDMIKILIGIYILIDLIKD
jgi:hypothetical protein